MQQLDRFEPVYSFLDYAFVCDYIHTKFESIAQ
jgi:hypothetical protein